MLSLPACASPAEDADVEPSASAISGGAGEVVLPRTALFLPGAQNACVTGLAATVTKKPDGVLVLTTERIQRGPCELGLLPMTSHYDVTSTWSCGSTIYEGKSAARTLKLSDDRFGKCADVADGTVELTFSREGGEVTGRFVGGPAADPFCPAVLCDIGKHCDEAKRTCVAD